MVLVPIACRAIVNKQGMTDMEISRIVLGIWSVIQLIQERPTLVELLDMRTPEVIPI